MKTLQNDLTTIEQSKRLLELGVPKNSVNHYYGKDDKLHYIDGTIPYSLLWKTECTPCWSVGRLIEIYELCVGERFERRANPSTLQLMPIMEDILEQYQMRIESIYRHMNFSKLEE